MSEPEIGSPEWIERRRRAWNDEALSLVKALERYEDEHPKEATCLQDAHKIAETALIQQRAQEHA